MAFTIRRIRNALSVRSVRYKILMRRKLLTWYRTVFHDRSGINLIGYFSYTFGVAEVGRFFARSALNAMIPVSIFETESTHHARLDDASLELYQPHYTLRPPYHKNIFFINADSICYFHDNIPELFLGRYNAAVFFWEFNDYFDFPDAYTVLDEVIAFTDFIATAVRKAAPPHIKVTKMPFPFTRNWRVVIPPATMRRQYGIGAETFVFIFNFDFHSVYHRKNPEAILHAFEAAFEAGHDVALILKTIHADTGAPNYRSFEVAVGQMHLRNKVILVNDHLERNEFMSMINASDCYVSLHRSEGLGLGMMEAMAMGKPVIGTGFGGNTDFMYGDNSLQVGYTLVPTGADVEPYKSGWLWAEPNVKEAAGYMLKLYQDRTFARELGMRAEASIMQQYSAEVLEKNIRGWMQST